MYIGMYIKKRIRRMILLVAVFAILISAAGTVWAEEAVCPTYEEAYKRMIVLSEKEYPEGMIWTNENPYGPGQPLGEHYQWKGGLIDGKKIVSVGCAAFAFVLSDEAFGSLPNRTTYRGEIKLENVRVGDILRVNGNSHVVIVLKVSPGGVIIAEGNYNGTVHWGRVMSKAEVENADLLLTRYPANHYEEPDADEVAYSGEEGSLSWTLTKRGVLTVSGSEAIPNYLNDGTKRPSWDTYKDKINTVVIEKGVTSIGNYAFYQYTNLLSVYIPDGVTSIGTGAFQESGLVAVTIPGSVASIGASAFWSCTNLTSVSTSEGLKIIGDNAFRGCMELRYIDFPASITTVGAGAFMSCKEMISIRFKPGTGDVTIGNGVFAQCWGLIYVTLPQKLQKISNDMFSSCTLLSEIYIPASVNDIGMTPFTSTKLQYGGILSYGGSKTAWVNAGGQSVLNAMPNMNIKYDVKFDDPFDVEGGSGIVEEDPETPTPGTHTHSWSESWSKDNAYHWHDCGADGCKITSNSDKDGYGEHSYGDWVVDAAGTAEQSGSRHRDCKVCGYRQTEDIPFDVEQGSGIVGEDPETPTPGAHTHSWSESWFNDNTHHWHNCEADGCNITDNSGKAGYGEHSYGSWVVDVTATAGQKGSRHRECAVCGYRQNEDIPPTVEPGSGSTGKDPETPTSGTPTPGTPTPGTPTSGAHTHSWSKSWSKNSAHHWHDCGAGGCNITSNSGKNGYGAHNYGSWVIDTKATAKKNGSRHRDCKVCGYRQTEKIPAATTTKKPVKVTKLKITNAPKTLKAGKSKTLKVKVTPTGATNKKVTWKSSNKKYATVNSKGKVTAKKAGKGKTVKITATAKDGSKKKVTVKIKIK